MVGPYSMWKVVAENFGLISAAIVALVCVTPEASTDSIAGIVQSREGDGRALGRAAEVHRHDPPLVGGPR